MLVLARRRHEAVLIDGTIRVEVLRVTGGVARLRVLAPQHVAVVRGVTKAGDQPAIEAVNGGFDGNGIGAVELVLCPRQLITIGSDFHVSLVDIDSTRAVLFFDVPRGTSVKAEDAERPRTRRTGRAKPAGQELLPFPTLFDPESDADMRK
jgi:carbon storage regulator CsrA